MNEMRANTVSNKGKTFLSFLFVVFVFVYRKMENVYQAKTAATAHKAHTYNIILLEEFSFKINLIPKVLRKDSFINIVTNAIY